MPSLESMQQAEKAEMVGKEVTVQLELLAQMDLMLIVLVTGVTEGLEEMGEMEGMEPVDQMEGKVATFKS